MNERKQRRAFFVFIVESPSALDLYYGRSEGALIQQALALEELPSVTRVAISKDAFIAALKIGITHEMQTFSKHLPIVHISAHGEETGLVLSNGEVCTWDELRELLLPINKALQGCLMLCMSSCKGFSACQMAMRMDQGEQPFFGMIGHTGEPTWSETAVAYASFYHLVAKGDPVPKAVEAMRTAAGDPGFIEITARQARDAFLDKVKKVDLLQAQETMRRQVQAQPLSSLAKALHK